MSELHRGVHGSLLDSPPNGISYALPPHTHWFAIPKSTDEPIFDPFEHFSVRESVSFDAPHNIFAGVHLSRIPLEGTLPWIVDTDCLMVTLRCGQSLAFGNETLVNSGTLSEAEILRRSALMMRRFADSSCYGILFHSLHALEKAVSFVKDTGILQEPSFERWMTKLDVIRPALPPSESRKPATQSAPIRILYMGRSGNDKGQDVAARVFACLDRSMGHAVVLHWVGPIPPNLISIHPDLQWYKEMPRTEYLDLLASCDVFFSPTIFESYGMGLVEAASFGLAIVTSCGPGMEHIGEIFKDGESALMIDNTFPVPKRINLYFKALSELVTQTELRLRLQSHSSRMVVDGCISLKKRDDTLVPLYERMASSRYSSTRRPIASTRLYSIKSEALLARYASAKNKSSRRVRIVNS